MASSTRPEVEVQPRDATELAPRYHLILLDDNDHSYEYVIEMLGAIFGYAVEKAYAIACAVDGTGRAIVETASHERVCEHQRAIHQFGPDPRIPRCRGSMSAIIEAAA